MRWLMLASLCLLACQREPVPVPSNPATAQAPPAVATAPPATTTTPAPPPRVHGPKLLPVDEGAGDAEFAAFRDALLATVRVGNIEGIVAVADPSIRTTFGAGGGHADLRRMLAQPRVLEELEQLLSLGGAFRGEGESRSFWAPYVYSAWPDEHDPFTSLAVISENVPLRAAPQAEAPAVALLSFDLVSRVSPPQAPTDADPPEFVEVTTADGRRGWVASLSLRSHVGYRAGFTRASGTWRMNALVAGD